MSESLTIIYVVLMALILFFCVHRIGMVTSLLFLRRQKSPETLGEWPRVTVQLPLYNEANVVERLIDAACRMDYPQDRLEVQVLDDSTDATRDLVSRLVGEWKKRGVDIVHLHRVNRSGYKAGALNEGTRVAKGDFMAIFDADFVPSRDFLKRAMTHFDKDRVGLVQARWGHLNRTESLLTRLQAMLLDAHFSVDQTMRNRAGQFFNFNGTAGVLRKACIEDAGGWRSDTLTEDLELSYRAQLRGWKFCYVGDLEVPSELPAEMDAFKSQQRRWTQGSVQTCRKLLGRVLGSDQPLHVKTEAFMHLCGNFVYLFVAMLYLLVMPLLGLLVSMEVFAHPLFIGATLVALGTGALFYVGSLLQQNRWRWSDFLLIPAAMGLSIGISLNNAKAVLEGLFGKSHCEFVRTPKKGDAKRRVYRANSQQWLLMLETLAAFVYTGLMVFHLWRGDFWIAASLLLFAFGFSFVALSSWNWPRLRAE